MSCQYRPDNDIRDRRVLVTGAAGFLGHFVVRLLSKAGYTVEAVDDGSAGTLTRLRNLAQLPGVSEHGLDVTDAQAMRDLVDRRPPWGVVHLAAHHFIPTCERNPDEVWRINVLGTQRLLDACAQQPDRVQRWFAASTADVYGPSPQAHQETDPVRPRGVYGVSKLAMEWLLRDQAHRLPQTGMVTGRLFNLVGPGDPHPHLLPEILTQAARSDRVRLGDLSTARDYLHVADAAHAVVALLTNPVTGTVNIGSGQCLTGQELLTLASHATGRRLIPELDTTRTRRWQRSWCQAETTSLDALLPQWPLRSVQEAVNEAWAEVTAQAHASTILAREAS
ncbi:NAD-dependent epimerase/dehydratase family protein [Saccharopolyspora endophytica]|uniref:NAD-dependent epimerase/dehydratase family protein n=1 Tax=Saccharopolyspora endophytica TaxID=543886 RepID=A0ABS5DR13_9PSEU|nr:NAD-dependent epimerase/dehydratase family protein [Saccharopolyspora endophytica]MBQ0928635.1 NAD-dependent epimerase/dehydratase family protein [Saccharopolyspora endophytica]